MISAVLSVVCGMLGLASALVIHAWLLPGAGFLLGVNAIQKEAQKAKSGGGSKKQKVIGWVGLVLSVSAAGAMFVLPTVTLK